MAGRLVGKVASITGPADGQGRAAVLAFARKGARVVGCDLKTDLAEETLARVRCVGAERVSLQPAGHAPAAGHRWQRAVHAFAADQAART